MSAVSDSLDQIEARVKTERLDVMPTRDDIARIIWTAMEGGATEGRTDGPLDWDYDAADAVLALLPGRTEAEVREQVAQELLSDASGRPFPYAYVRLMNPLRGEPPVRTFRAAVEILARGIARGGER